ncbi:hypothetical protein FisN_UnNu100, partial [Fistulifera solaris]
MSSDSETDDRKPPPVTAGTRLAVSPSAKVEKDVQATFSEPVLAPKFGLVQGSIPAIGGPPDANFTRSVNLVPATPYCFRDPNPYRAEKSFKDRIAGLDPKFSPTANDYRLVELADEAFNHCITHGLDTPFYMNDPADLSRVIDLFVYHGKFTFDEVAKHLEDMIKSGVFDQYMINSLSDSAAFLLNSLERSFQRTIRTSLSSGHARFGPLVWMKITEEVLPNAFRRVSELGEEFTKRTLVETPGENVAAWANAQMETLQELEANDQLPRDHLIILQQQLCKCSVEAFRVHWHTKLASLSDFVRLSAGKSKEVAERMSGYTNYRRILHEAKDFYSTLKDDWGPAKGVATDVSANTAAIKSLKAEFKTLKSKFESNGTKTASSKTKDKKANKDKAAPKASGGDGEKKSGGSTETRWTRIAPKDGEPTTMTKYGKTFYYCAKCKRWNQTHGTDEHKSKEEKPADAKPAAPAANVAQAWTAPLQFCWVVACPKCRSSSLSWSSAAIHAFARASHLSPVSFHGAFFDHDEHVASDAYARRPRCCLWSQLGARLAWLLPHGEDGVFRRRKQNRFVETARGANVVEDFEAIPRWALELPDMIDSNGHLCTESLDLSCPPNGHPKPWNLLDDSLLFCYPTGHFFPEGAASEMHVAGKPTMADLFPVIWDTGATVAVTFDRADFTSYTPTTGDKVLSGFAAGSSIAGTGTLEWTVTLSNGKGFTFRIPGLHVPDANVRLFSPQSYCQLVKAQRNDEPRFSGDSSLIHVDLLDGHFLDIVYSPENNLPTLEMFRKQSVALNAAKIRNCVTAAENQNLSEAQKFLLRLHFRFVHRSMKNIQALLKTGALGKSAEVKAAARCDIPKCAACMYGKGKRKSTGAKLTVDRQSKVLSKDILIPGQKVSMDHFSVSTRGRLYSGFGGTKDDEKFKGGVIFVDHASGFVYVVHVLNFTAGEALRAKLEFESAMANHGITVVQYHTDNGTFTAQEFTKQIDTNYQSMTLSGPGAHHQNAVAERAIGSIISLARTTMLHAKLRWPKAISSDLWPQAIDYVVQNFNYGPGENNSSPADMIFRTTTDRKVFADMHVWGSPAYILNPQLQDGHKIPKFEPRSRRGVFLGLSKRHASNVPVVLNLETNRISAQFHVVVDDWFATVSNVVNEDDSVDPETWADIFASSRFQVFFDEDDPIDLDDEWLSQDELHVRIQERSRKIRSVQDTASPPVDFDKVHQRLRTDAEPTTEKSSNEPTLQREPEQKTVTTPVKLSEPISKPVEPIPAPKVAVDAKPPSSSPRKKTPAVPAEPRRSTRERRAPKRFNEFITNVASVVLAPIPRETFSFIASIHSGLVACWDSEIGEFDLRDPVAFAAMQRAKKPKKGSDPDYPMYHQAMSSAEYREWQEAMVKEIRMLEMMGTWKKIPRASVPANKRVIKSTWAFRLKRSPDGTPTKYKARFCVRGDMEIKGVDYFESYSPVVQWSTVRLLLIMSIVHGMHTRQVDYVNAFAQAPLPPTEECYIEMPQGFHDDGEDTVLMLQKTLYGKSDSPLRFFNLLKDTLEKHGFKQLVDIDACLFVHEKIICLTYVDDCLWFSLDEKCMDDMIDTIDKVLTLTVESKDVSAFLGIQFTRRGDTIELTQKGLIKRVIEATDMADCNSCDTPAENKPLGKDLAGAAFAESWNYASVVGMLLYLSSNSRPDIAFAV